MESPWIRPQAQFADLRAFLDALEASGDLATVDTPVDPNLELTEISRRVLARGGPALLFTNAGDGNVRVLDFGTQ